MIYAAIAPHTPPPRLNRLSAADLLYARCVARRVEAPLELGFLEQYGHIMKHLWFGDGYMMLGFRSGQVRVPQAVVKVAVEGLGAALLLKPRATCIAHASGVQQIVSSA